MTKKTFTYEELTAMSTEDKAARHTPGPWRAKNELRESKRGWTAYVISPIITVASVYANSREEAEVNAAMMAAAPDLAEALIEMLDSNEAIFKHTGLTVFNNQAKEKAQAALTKAGLS